MTSNDNFFKMVFVLVNLCIKIVHIINYQCLINNYQTPNVKRLYL